MEELYTGDDLEELDERVGDLADEYDLTDTARDAMYNIWETVLTNGSYDVESITDSTLEEHARGSPQELTVPTKDDGVIYVDLTEEEGNWMHSDEESERKPFSQWTDEEARDKLGGVYTDLARLGHEKAKNLNLALGEFE